MSERDLPDSTATVHAVAWPCGRRPADLADLASGADSDPDLRGHVRDCPFCRPELDAQTARWQTVRRAAATPVIVPADLVSRVLTSVRGIRGRNTAEPIELEQPGGRLRIGEPVVVLIARQLVRDYADAHGGIWERGVLAGRDEPITVLIAVRFGTDIGQAAADLREHLHRQLPGYFGDPVPAVDVTVVDVIPTPPIG